MQLQGPRFQFPPIRAPVEKNPLNDSGVCDSPEPEEEEAAAFPPFIRPCICGDRVAGQFCRNVDHRQFLRDRPQLPVDVPPASGAGSGWTEEEIFAEGMACLADSLNPQLNVVRTPDIVRNQTRWMTPVHGGANRSRAPNPRFESPQMLSFDEDAPTTDPRGLVRGWHTSTPRAPRDVRRRGWDETL